MKLLAINCSSPALGAFLGIVKRIIGLIQMAAPILLIIALSIHITNLVRNPEEKKTISKIKNSVIATFILFFIPTFINVVMNLLGENYAISSCWDSIHFSGSNGNYVEVDDRDRQRFFIDPGEYEKGKKKVNNKSGGGSGESIEGTAKQIGDVVWDSSDVTKISNLTSTQLIGILNAYGGNAKNFIPYAQGLITAEHKYNVNVFFLIGVEALESGWITSNISRNCNNLGGVCASSNHPSNGCGSNSNCSFAYFNSASEFIDYHASMLHNNYLTPGGAYYHGTSPSAVVTNYCPGCTEWPGSVTSIANSLFSKVSSVI